MNSLRFLLVSILVSIFFQPAAMAATPLPRTVLALYDSAQSSSVHKTPIHLFAEMPLNHLGLKVEYHDIQSPPPVLRDDIRGVLAWTLKNPISQYRDAYIDWAEALIKRQKKFVLMGDEGFWLDNATPQHESFKLLQAMGIRASGYWFYPLESMAMNYPVYDAPMVEFERRFKDSGALGLKQLEVLSKAPVTVHLAGERQGRQGVMVLTSPQGGMVANGYAVYSNITVEPQIRQWLINPFLFFKAAFDTVSLPKPDVTTLVGQRLYFSHIDGDGWNNVSSVEPYKQQEKICAEVILEEAVKKYPDLPVSMGIIAAEVDPDWAGTAQGIQAARDLLAQPQVEASSHTYSHPFDWGFFDQYLPAKEKPLLHLYEGKVWTASVGQPSWLPGFLEDSSVLRFFQKGERRVKAYNTSYDIPRAYASKPFDMEQEITGANKVIEGLAPPGKRVRLLQWSGNTQPYEAFLKRTREVGMVNMNGGDSRFDADYPSYAWVPPIGVAVGKEYQVYAGNSNENTYTNTWQQMFHAYRYLRQTVQHTEQPIRLKPFNIYYHIYSGQYQASINALRQMLDDAKAQPLTRITASTYAALADGFRPLTIIPVAPNHWRFEQRGTLNTIRFDDALATLTIDWSRSKGVIGYRYYQNSLYVALEPSARLVEIALNNRKTSKPNLRSSRWPLQNVEWQAGGRLAFKAQGYGDAEMVWQDLSPNTPYQLQHKGRRLFEEVSDAQGTLTVRFPFDALQEQSFTLEPLS
jgi:polysaccharide biosynthesis protein PelA